MVKGAQARRCSRRRSTCGGLTPWTRGGKALLVGGVDAGSPAEDKFVICQVLAYTKGKDAPRKALDSLTALWYDNKRKLICVICGGIIIGAGNDRQNHYMGANMVHSQLDILESPVPDETDVVRVERCSSTKGVAQVIVSRPRTAHSEDTALTDMSFQ